MRRHFFIGIFILLIAALFVSPVTALTQTLRKGSKGVEVTELQKFLSGHPDLYPEKSVTGYFGAKTEAAVRRFQKRYGILQTGMVGPKTRGKINDLSAPVKTAPPTSANNKTAPSSPPNTQFHSTNRLSNEWSQGKCVGTGAVTFTSAPMRLSDVAYILPMGLMSGSHVTPVDHIYLHTAHGLASTYDVLAPANGYVVQVGNVPDSNDYRIVLEHSCTFYTIYIHVTTLAPKVAAATGPIGLGGNKWIRVPVSAGDVIGTKISDPAKGRYQVDFSVADADIILSGFVVPKHYDGEIWKIHTIDPYQHFTPSLRTTLEEKTNRSVPPIGGKIDYDIDGRLVGNWFLEGTGGYSATNRERYWSGHLTIAYDYLDPTGVSISTGDWLGDSAQFAVLGNAPDPKDVSVETGMVKYELIRNLRYQKNDGTDWDRWSLAKDLHLRTEGDVDGVILLHLLSGRKLKLEIFPGKRSADVLQFTTNARIYER